MKLHGPPKSGSKGEYSLTSLLAELDSNLRHEVGRLIASGLQHDPFRGLYIKDADASELVGSLGQTGIVDWGWAAEDRLKRLADAFKLSRSEVQALVAAAVSDVDLRYERVFAYLQDDVTRKRPTVDLLLRLAWPDTSSRVRAMGCFRAAGRLRATGLIQLDQAQEASLLARFVRVDERVVAFLLGSDEVDERLAAVAHLLQPKPGPAPASDAVGRQVEAAGRLCGDGDARAVIVLEGPPGAGKTEVGLEIASRLGRGLLVVDVPDLMQLDIPSGLAVRLSLREAVLHGALLYLSGGGSLFEDGDRARSLRAAMLAGLENMGGLLFISGRAPLDVPAVIAGTPVTRITLPMPANLERHEFWKSLAGRTVADNSLQSVAGAFRLTPGQIREAYAIARHRAALRGADGLEPDDLHYGCRAVSGRGLAAVADEMVSRARWDDMVLPADSMAQLRELCATVRCRAVVLDRWGFAAKLSGGSGTTALFAGPSGTGKTMAAGVIAGELGLPLFRIDLARVVSKWIGETEKNLDRVFKAAEDSNAVLFLDEADALLGKRSEVKDSHDRYANLEISYLLQRMELYDGLAILATNMRQLIDEAFIRRLTFTVLFPLPDEADRRRLWSTLWPADLPRAANLDLDRLAKFRLPGGNIKNVLLAAAYLAAAEGSEVRMDHVLHGVRREYQKIGKQMTEAELTR